MAKKKYKIMFNNLEISSTNIDDFVDFQNLLHKAAQFERQSGHLKICEEFERKADSIIAEIGAQI